MYMYIGIALRSILTNYFHRIIWFQVFLSNTNNLHSFVSFPVFLSNTNNLHTLIWFQVFLSITNNLYTYQFNQSPPHTNVYIYI